MQLEQWHQQASRCRAGRVPFIACISGRALRLTSLWLSSEHPKGASKQAAGWQVVSSRATPALSPCSPVSVPLALHAQHQSWPCLPYGLYRQSLLLNCWARPYSMRVLKMHAAARNRRQLAAEAATSECGGRANASPHSPVRTGQASCWASPALLQQMTRRRCLTCTSWPSGRARAAACCECLLLLPGLLTALVQCCSRTAVRAGCIRHACVPCRGPGVSSTVVARQCACTCAWALVRRRASSSGALHCQDAGKDWTCFDCMDQHAPL